MRYNKAIAVLQNLTDTRIKQQDIAQILGVTKQAITNRIKREVEFNDIELNLICKHYKIDVDLINQENKKVNNFLENEHVEIPYWEELPDSMKHPEYNYVLAQKTSIQNGWGLEAENLRIIPMVGDKMSNYWYPIKSGDIIIIDVSQNQIMGNGVYFATSRNNTYYWIREMQRLFNESVEFKGYSPSGNTTKTLTLEQLQEADFRLIGKVIKNVSFRL